MRSLINPRIDEFSSRCPACLNSCGISLLFCFIVRTSVNFFVFQLICKVNRHKEIICSPASVLTRNRLKQCADDITCQSTSYFIIFFAQIPFCIYMYFVAQSHIIQILIPYLRGFFGIYCRNPCLPLKGSNFSLMQTAEPTKYNDLHKPMNMSPKKDTIVVFYSTLSPQKCKKLNTEKQNTQSHLGSNLTPER